MRRVIMTEWAGSERLRGQERQCEDCLEVVGGGIDFCKSYFHIC